MSTWHVSSIVDPGLTVYLSAERKVQSMIRQTSHVLMFWIGVGCVFTRAAEPIDARVPEASAILKSTGSSLTLLRVPEQLEVEHQDGRFTVAKEAPSVDFALLPMQKPMPDAETWLFSSWGDITFASDGSFYVAHGDHQSLPGHAWVSRVDPGRRRIDTVVDVNKVLQPSKGNYGPGKIHAPLIDTGDYLYFIPYRGAKKYCQTEYGFKGEHLMRYHYSTGLTEDLGIPIPNCSVAQMNYHAGSNRLYLFGAWCPAQEKPMSQFAVFDLMKQQVVFRSDAGAEPFGSLRCMLVAKDGRVWYTTGRVDESGPTEVFNNRFAVYDPKRNEATLTGLRSPAGDVGESGQIRAASEPDRDGVVWCITKAWGTKGPRHGAIFPFDTKSASFGLNRGLCFAQGPPHRPIRLYAAVAKLNPSKTKLYYIPGAHGGAANHGAALIQYDTRTNVRKVIAFLRDHVKREAGYSLGGTYGLAVSEDGGTVCINWMDERDPRQKETVRRAAVTLVHIPESER